MGQSTNLPKSKGTKRPAARSSDIESDAATLEARSVQELMAAAHELRETASAFFTKLKDLPPDLRRLKSTEILYHAMMKLLGLSPQNGKEVDLVSMMRQALKDEGFDCPEWIETMEYIEKAVERRSEFIRNFRMPGDEVPGPEGGRVGDDDVVATNAIEAEQDVHEADNHEV